MHGEHDARVASLQRDADDADELVQQGKNLGLVDPNSTSGNNVARFELDKMGIPDPGMNLPCLDGAASQTYASKSGLMPA